VCYLFLVLFLTPSSTLFPYTTLFRSRADVVDFKHDLMVTGFGTHWRNPTNYFGPDTVRVVEEFQRYYGLPVTGIGDDVTLQQIRSEEHTSELQSRENLVCRLLLEKNK